MIQNVLRDIGGIGVYGVISVCLFFAVFFGATMRALMLRKETAHQISLQPLHDELVERATSGKVNHES